ncbi:MAG: hypothetical protein K2X99_08960 [Gemmatimonadaceae bacterium]|nr:hypothetical protein [Gemmatimonadaceae bacterium]
MSAPRRVLGVALLAMGCGGAAPSATSAPVDSLAVGVPITDTNGWVELTLGTAPLVLVAPHGGSIAPASLADRSCAVCVTGNDANTQDLARRIVESFAQRTGRRPQLVVNRLDRAKFDANRDRDEATGGAPVLFDTWATFHRFIDSASARAVRAGNGRALLLDLHGHAHPIARIELGYLLSESTLRASDATIQAALTQSSIARLVVDRRSGDDPLTVLRGATSFGGALAAAGYAAVPSPTAPAPLVGEPFFDGGYNTQRHGSRAGGVVDAIQLEHPFPGLRDSAANRQRYADSLAAITVRFLQRQYGWTPAR